jgi:hypothetical protein
VHPFAWRAIVSLLVLAGCHFGHVPAPPAPSAEERELAASLEAVAYGGAVTGAATVKDGRGEPATERVVGGRVSEGLILTRTPSSALLVERAREPVAVAVHHRDDVAVEDALRGTLATDRVGSRYNVDVDVDDGVVLLAGDVKDAIVAAHLVRLAIRTKGVRAVESWLTWPPRAELERLGNARP